MDSTDASKTRTEASSTEVICEGEGRPCDAGAEPVSTDTASMGSGKEHSDDEPNPPSSSGTASTDSCREPLTESEYQVPNLGAEGKREPSNPCRIQADKKTNDINQCNTEDLDGSRKDMSIGVNPVPPLDTTPRTSPIIGKHAGTGHGEEGAEEIREARRESSSADLPPVFRFLMEKGASSSEPATSSDLDESSSILAVEFVQMPSNGPPKSSVLTYNDMLEAVATSSQPKPQDALNILATMRSNGVAPDEKTWDLLEHCAGVTDQIDDDEISIEDLKDGNSKTWRDFRDDSLGCLSLYSADSFSDEDNQSEGSTKGWQMEQELGELPPAFRHSIVSMLKEKNVGRQRSRKYEAVQLIAQGVVESRRKVYLPSEKAPLELIEPARRVLIQPPNELFLPPKTQGGEKEDDSHLKGMAGGVVQYRRPDGVWATARLKVNKSDEEKGDFDINEEIAKIRPPDLGKYNTLLTIIAKCSLSDKANRAGKVLRSMKENQVVPDNDTRDLLEKCTWIAGPPVEPKPHEGILKPILMTSVDASDDDVGVTPVQTKKKKVRFSETNSFRIIRRRRSISSMERWDDPLTPPKRVTDFADLAPGRFSSGLQDNRPSLPRRSDSLSSLLSGGSERTVSSSEGEDSYNGSPVADRFRLPFAVHPLEEEMEKSDAEPSIVHEMKVPSRKADSSISEIPKPKSVDFPSMPVRRTRSDEFSPVGRKDWGKSQLPLSPVVEMPLAPILAPAPQLLPTRRRRPLRRRGSISCVERRDAPIFPPRRISARVDLMSGSLKKSQSADNVRRPNSTQKAKKVKSRYPSQPDKMDKANIAASLSSKDLKGKKPSSATDIPYSAMLENLRQSQKNGSSKLGKSTVRRSVSMQSRWKTLDMLNAQGSKSPDDEQQPPSSNTTRNDGKKKRKIKRRSSDITPQSRPKDRVAKSKHSMRTRVKAKSKVTGKDVKKMASSEDKAEGSGDLLAPSSST